MIPPAARTDAEHYADAFSEAYKSAITPDDAIDHIGIIDPATA